MNRKVQLPEIGVKIRFPTPSIVEAWEKQVEKMIWGRRADPLLMGDTTMRGRRAYRNSGHEDSPE